MGYKEWLEGPSNPCAMARRAASSRRGEAHAASSTLLRRTRSMGWSQERRLFGARGLLKILAGGRLPIREAGPLLDSAVVFDKLAITSTTA